MNDCDCSSCQSCTVKRELAPEAMAVLTEQFRTLKQRAYRIEQIRAVVRRRRDFRDRWDYPYE